MPPQVHTRRQIVTIPRRPRHKLGFDAGHSGQKPDVLLGPKRKCLPPARGHRPDLDSVVSRGRDGNYEYLAKTEGPADLGGSQVDPEDNKLVHFTTDLLQPAQSTRACDTPQPPILPLPIKETHENSLSANPGGGAGTALNIPVDQIPALHPPAGGPTEAGLLRSCAASTIDGYGDGVVGKEGRISLSRTGCTSRQNPPAVRLLRAGRIGGRACPMHFPSPEPPTCSPSCWHFRQITHILDHGS